MRLVMMGTGPFAVPTLDALLRSEHEVAALITRPAVEAKTHGKAKTPPNPMRLLAESRGVAVMAPENINEATAQRVLANLGAELLVVCDYGQILAPETLGLAPLGGINLHGSLLPKYRGAAPVHWAIWNGDDETGITVIHMTPKLDAGPCLIQRRLRIDTKETTAELEPRLAQLGVAPVLEAIDLLARWDRVSTIGIPQDKSLATRAPRLKKTDGEIDWSRSADEIERQFRALQPWPGVFTHLIRAGQQPLRIILEELATIERPGTDPPGTIDTRSGQLIVVAGQNVLSVARLQPAGKRSMDAAEFLRGHRLDAGERFGRA